MLGAEHLHVETAKPKVLIVDDTATVIKILKETLESDFEICSAANGGDGLTMASSHPPDLILLDIKLPDLNGHKFCETLKNDPVTKKIPVIFITSMAEIEDEAKGFELGAVDYIRKPFNITVVKAW